ncbi:uncharacterized protein LOC113345212 [Papaver somniferum]|uniref:uncharacterized protein LOC113345212 n=1 Tax=Papaver somniferum TaxID=3469 RepID=UPI000E6F7551|nr:uncharacterized protein LOC113345212 [Papaver somniferum]
MNYAKRDCRDEIQKCLRLMAGPRKLRIIITVDGVTIVPGVPIDVVISFVVSSVDNDDVPIYVDAILGVPLDAVSSVENADVPAYADVPTVNDDALPSTIKIIDEDPDVPDMAEDPKYPSEVEEKASPGHLSFSLHPRKHLYLSFNPMMMRLKCVSSSIYSSFCRHKAANPIFSSSPNAPSSSKLRYFSSSSDSSTKYPLPHKSRFDNPYIDRYGNPTKISMDQLEEFMKDQKKYPVISLEESKKKKISSSFFHIPHPDLVEEEARMKIYSMSTKCYFALGAIVSEDVSYKIKIQNMCDIAATIPRGRKGSRNKCSEWVVSHVQQHVLLAHFLQML